MQRYIEFVHNLIGTSLFDNLNSRTKEAIISTLKYNFLDHNDLERSILKESGSRVFEFVSEHLDLKRYFNHIVFTTESKSYVENVNFDNVRAIINFKKINHIRYINEHLRSVNKLLPDAGFYIGRIETYWERKLRIYGSFGRTLGRMIWIMDFFINRVIPRLKYIDKIYFYLTKGAHHTISKSEILGRLVYCGFSIIDYKIIDGLLYFVVIKISEPRTDRSASFHPIIKLNRVGKNGQMIGIYKLRTMHPYSEYLQDYILKLNGYNDLGKPKDDFRITRWGKILRRYWIDELPQLINVLKGEMKLVGIRPLSLVRFNQLPEDLRKERINHKPGCFPPYVALCMPDDKGNIEAEKIYLRDKAINPHLTDLRYFIKSVFNIITNKIRSS
jgi:lipopolysaccharide/colanic/teichoic acid biosynthesis glycosyltransferase